MLEMKNISEIRNIFNEFFRRLNIAEEGITEIENIR